MHNFLLIQKDVDDIKFVINFDFPMCSEDYVHRIGRTGRSNKSGTAYTFFTTSNVKQASDLIAVLREAKQVINPKLIEMADSSRGGFGAKRRNWKMNNYMRFKGGYDTNKQNRMKIAGGSWNQVQNGKHNGFGEHENQNKGGSYFRGFGSHSFSQQSVSNGLNFSVNRQINDQLVNKSILGQYRSGAPNNWLQYQPQA